MDNVEEMSEQLKAQAALQVAEIVVEYLNEEDRSVGINWIGKLNQEVVDDIIRDVEGINLVSWDVDYLIVDVDGVNVLINKKVNEFDEPELDISGEIVGTSKAGEEKWEARITSK